MAMEQRQRQIVEGAGREQSRLNTDFIEMLTKWGPHLLLGLAVIVGAYAAYNWWNRKSLEKVDSAYVSLNAAAVSGSHESLERVAVESASINAVSMNARAMAAEIHMQAARSGIPVGEKLEGEKLPEGKAFLTDEQKKAELAKAEEHFKAIVKDADSTFGQTLIAIGALNGLAGISEDRGEFDKARDYYNQAAAKAASTKIKQLEANIKRRLDTLDALKSPPRLFDASELPGYIPLAPPPSAAAPGAPMPITITPNADGTITIPGLGTPDAPAPVTPAPGSSTPQPAPADPAPAPAPANPAPATTPSGTP